jgi:hypothetical protein
LSSGFRGVSGKGGRTAVSPMGRVVRANSHLAASTYEPNNSTIVSIRQAFRLAQSGCPNPSLGCTPIPGWTPLFRCLTRGVHSRLSTKFLSTKFHEIHEIPNFGRGSGALQDSGEAIPRSRLVPILAESPDSSCCRVRSCARTISSVVIDTVIGFSFKARRFFSAREYPRKGYSRSIRAGSQTSD